MTMRKKTLLLLAILLLILSLTACSRDRFRQGWRNSATLAADSLVSIPVPVDDDTSMGDLSEDAEELDDLMNEIDQIFRDTDTTVNIP